MFAGGSASCHSHRPTAHLTAAVPGISLLPGSIIGATHHIIDVRAEVDMLYAGSHKVVKQQPGRWDVRLRKEQALAEGKVYFQVVALDGCGQECSFWISRRRCVPLPAGVAGSGLVSPPKPSVLSGGCCNPVSLS